MLCYLAILPPVEITKKVNQIRKTSNQGNISEPHITIVSPFTPNIPLKELASKIKTVVKKIEPFEICLDGVNSFNKGENSVLYLSAKGSSLSKLQKNIISDISGDLKNLKTNFTPLFHLTILKRMDYSKIEKYQKEVNAEELKTRFKASEIVMFVIKSNEPWQIFERIKIGDNISK